MGAPRMPPDRASAPVVAALASPAGRVCSRDPLSPGLHACGRRSARSGRLALPGARDGAGPAVRRHPGCSPRRSGRSTFPLPTSTAPAPAGRARATGSSESITALPPRWTPRSQQLRGRETIHYTNNSPDALSYLWMFVEQNICAPNSITKQLDQPPLVFLGSTFDFSCKGFNGGVTLERVRCCGDARAPGGLRDHHAGRSSPAARRRAERWTSRSPGTSPVPDYGAGRMGRDGSLYEIAQWYPRLAVYDDVRGWNHEPYIGAGEFYLEYGGFDVSLTVPAELHRRRDRRAAEPRAGAHAGAAEPAAAARRSRPSRSP